MMELDYIFHCRDVLWAIVFGISIVYISNGLILLQKAYLIVCRQKWVLYVGIPSMVPQLAYPIFSVCFTYVTIETEAGCVAHYPPAIIWYWLGITLPLNLLLSAIFCYVSFRQYRTHGSDAWRRLARDGVQAMCLAVLCNIFCWFVIAFQIGGINADLLFPGDWVIVSTILTHHCQNMRQVTNFSHRPKISYLHGSSQIGIASSRI
ncbi:hypothetical protein BDF19DRAFT_450894, partial [Syncephalis fuscata]